MPTDKMVPAPPWVVFDHGDGVAEILPAGRPGQVFTETMPTGLATLIVSATNCAWTEVWPERLGAAIRTTRRK